MISGPRHRRPSRSGRSDVLAIAAAAAVLALIVAAVLILRPQAGSPDSGSPAGSPAWQVGGSASASDRSGQSSSSPDPFSQPGATSQPDVSSSPPERTDPPVDSPEPYDFTQPIPEGEPVDNSYFDDAAFVGDSRTDGFMIYSGIGTGANLTSNGLSIYTLPTKKALTVDGKKYTLLEALALKEYGKVYLSLGVNELGYHDDEHYYQKYSEAIDAIRRVQPNAVIYIQGLIPLNEGQIQAANGNKYNLTNQHLRVYNDLMKQIAEEKQVAYLDLYTEFVNEDGELPKEASQDGVHLTKEFCQRWLTYLKTHTVEFDTLYPDGPPAVGEAGETADRSEQG